MTETLQLFVACLPGLEECVGAECAELGVAAEPPRIGSGGVAARGDRRAVARLVMGLACASHVLIRVARFGARHFAELCQKTGALDWAQFLGASVPVAVRATSRHSRLVHTGAISERITAVLAERLGRDLSGAGDPVTLLVRMEGDECTLSLDAAGRPLQDRGWRLETGRAPLREDLAAALVRASGWRCDVPLVDPMCGSGTIAIEAAIRARRLAAGRLRSFSCEGMVGFDPDLLGAVRAEFAASAQDATPVPIAASDRDAGAVGIATRNAERAGVASDISFARAALSAAPGLALAAERGMVVCNPPFGQRIGTAETLGPLWQGLGHRLRALGPGWRLAVLAADRRAALRTGLPLRTAFLSNHGGLRVRALVGGTQPVRTEDAQREP